MRRSKFNEPKVVLIFNGYKLLIAIAGSLHNASDLTGGNLQAISSNCTGKKMSSGGFYFRHLIDEIQIERADFGTLNIEDYDNMCGQIRSYHTPDAMMKKRIKSKIKKRKKDKKDGAENNECDK